MKNFVIAAKMMIVFLAIVIIVVCSFYRYEISPIDKNGEEVSFKVEAGDTWYTIGSNLYELNLVRSYKFYKIYIKLFKPGTLEAGEYKLSHKMSLPEIIDTLEKGGAVNTNLGNITFNEGINMRKIANIISEKTENTYDDVMNTLKDTEYIDSLIKEYWFLTDEIKNNDIYYPLEGYLAPNTYEIDKTSDVKTIFKVMLNQMDKELSKYKDDIEKSKYTVHQMLTLASIIELEAGNAADRNDVAGVFYNRLKNKWTLGSDVTTYYALKIDDSSHILTTKELATCNKYNTRGNCVVGLPVGPVSNPSLSSIDAAIRPTEHKMFYFVADCDGKTYLARNESEHNRNIKKLIEEGKWACFMG